MSESLVGCVLLLRRPDRVAPLDRADVMVAELAGRVNRQCGQNLTVPVADQARHSLPSGLK